MNQRKQNTYFRVVIPSIPSQVTSYGTITFNVGPGVYDIDGSIMNCKYISESDNNFDTMYARSDCYVPVNAPARVTLDGEEIAQYQNLAVTQL